MTRFTFRCSITFSIVDMAGQDLLPSQEKDHHQSFEYSRDEETQVTAALSTMQNQQCDAQVQHSAIQLTCESTASANAQFVFHYLFGFIQIDEVTD